MATTVYSFFNVPVVDSEIPARDGHCYARCVNTWTSEGYQQHAAFVPALAGAAGGVGAARAGWDVGDGSVGFGDAVVDGDDSASLALLEPASRWGLSAPETTMESLALSGRKVAVEHAATVDQLAAWLVHLHGS